MKTQVLALSMVAMSLTSCGFLDAEEAPVSRASTITSPIPTSSASSTVSPDAEPAPDPGQYLRSKVHFFDLLPTVQDAFEVFGEVWRFKERQFHQQPLEQRQLDRLGIASQPSNCRPVAVYLAIGDFPVRKAQFADISVGKGDSEVEFSALKFQNPDQAIRAMRSVRATLTNCPKFTIELGGGSPFYTSLKVEPAGGTTSLHWVAKLTTATSTASIVKEGEYRRDGSVVVGAASHSFPEDPTITTGQLDKLVDVMEARMSRLTK